MSIHHPFMDDIPDESWMPEEAAPTERELVAMSRAELEKYSFGFNPGGLVPSVLTASKQAAAEKTAISIQEAMRKVQEAFANAYPVISHSEYVSTKPEKQVKNRQHGPPRKFFDKHGKKGR